MDDLEQVSQHADNPKIAGNMSDSFPDSLSKWERFLGFAINDKQIFYIAIEINGQASGGIGLKPCEDVHRYNAEMGYWLSEKYWGKGIMTEVVIEFVQLSFHRFPDIRRIFARPFGTNISSRAVLEKAGFKLEARFEKTIFKNGKLLDEYIYAIRRK